MDGPQRRTHGHSARPIFRKVLYDSNQKLYYADNYVDSTFLSSIRHDTQQARPYTYHHVFLSTLPITQHLCTIAAFIGIFARLYDDSLDPQWLLWATAVCTLIGYLWWENRSGGRKQGRSVAILSTLSVSLMLVLLSPILKTLTQSTTSDTIWTLTIILFGLNALLADYSNPLSSAEESLVRTPEGFPAALSLNAAISASTVLASRLSDPSDAHARVFSLLLFAVTWFALFPILRKDWRRETSWFSSSLLTLVLLLFAIWTIQSISINGAKLLILTTLGLTFGAPTALFLAAEHKNEVKGPWDAAVPRID